MVTPFDGIDVLLSDGVPEPVGDKGDSERLMPPAPRVSRPLDDEDKTRPIRRFACLTQKRN